MFKGFQDTSSQSQFKGFPNLNMQGAVSAYGFSGVSFWLDAAYGLNTQTNLGAVSSWQQRVGGGTFVQATAGNQPRLILNDINYNNYPSIEAQDVNRFLLADNGLKFNVPTITVAVISKVNTARTSNFIITDGGATPSGILDGGSSAGINGFGNVSAAIIGLQGSSESLNARIKIITGSNVIVNGISETTSGSIGSLYIELKRLFQNNAGLSTISTIAEIIAFPYSMTSTDAIALSDRINQKYALY